MSQQPSKFGSTARPGDDASDNRDFNAGETILVTNTSGGSSGQRLVRVAVMRPIGRKDASTD